MKNQESTLQIACVKWFRYQYPEPKYLIWATPNGGARNAITGAILKVEGVRSGIPDLIIATEGKIFFIEMKSGKNKVSENQKAVIKMLDDMRFITYICYDFQDFKKVVDGELNN